MTIKGAQRLGAWLQWQGIDASAYWRALETGEQAEDWLKQAVLDRKAAKVDRRYIASEIILFT